MLQKTYSVTLQGINALAVEIEINNTGQGEGTIVTIVGLPDTAVRESKERVFSAVKTSGFIFPHGHSIINLAPANLKKAGSAFDLPIAISLIACSMNISQSLFKDKLIVGELALDGSVRPCQGAISMALLAKEMGYEYLLLPAENAKEAAMLKGIKVIAINHLKDAILWLTGDLVIHPSKNQWEEYIKSPDSELDFIDIKGQELLKRAMEVSAAGRHNLLMIGTPGTGKSMAASRLSTILPPMTMEESLETSKVHSIVGLLNKDMPVAVNRPFRCPHHSISDAGLIGGHSTPRPGEISLAHNGILFLDEFPEFKRSVIEVMRQPLESGEVTISRANGTVTFPANFQLIAAMNPCPCGYLNSPRRQCRCTISQVMKYRSKISGPLLDRIDIHVEVNQISEDELMSLPQGESSAMMRQRVIQAHEKQRQRFCDNTNIFSNSQMSSKTVRQFCQIDNSAKNLLRSAIQSLNLSARAYDRILKVARTIADLDEEDEIQSSHLAEAIQFRTLDRQMW